MTTLTYDFPKFTQISEASLKTKTDKELVELWDDNQANIVELHNYFNDHFCTAPEYDQAYIKAKRPLDDTDNLIYIEITVRHQAEVKREQAEREVRALAAVVS